MQTHSRKIVVVEMCGVLYECETDNTKTPLPILPNPKKDAEYFLQWLSARFKVQIYYSGNYQTAYDWLTQHNMMRYVSQITDDKGTHICIDSRVITTYGDYDGVIQSLSFFVSWFE